MIRLNLFEQTIVTLKQQCDMLRKADRPITIDETNTLEFLYKQIRRALNFADKNCTKVRSGQVAYSPEVRKAYITMKGRKGHPRTREQERIIKNSTTQDQRHLQRWMRHLMH